MDVLLSLPGFPKIRRGERVQRKDIQEVKPHVACKALKCDLRAPPQSLMGKLRTSHKLSRVSKISLQRSFYFHIFEAAFPFCFFSKPVKMSIKGYNYVVSLIAYLKQNLQGFNARFEKGRGGREIGILMDTILKMNLFWGEESLGHRMECTGEEVESAPIAFYQNAHCWPILSPAV